MIHHLQMFSLQQLSSKCCVRESGFLHDIQVKSCIWEQINVMLLNKNIYIRDRAFFFYFNVLCKWPQTFWMIFIKITDIHDNQFYKLSKLIANNDQMSVKNICHCIDNSCFESCDIFGLMIIVLYGIVRSFKKKLRPVTH